MYDIEQVVRHRKPMLLIDELINYTDISAQVRVTISEHCEFFNTRLDAVPSYIGIEYMAQCIAAYSGANDLDNDQKPQLGFLLGTRKYKPEVDKFFNGQTLIVLAEEIMSDSNGLSVFLCSITDEATSNQLATAKINVFQPDNVGKQL